MSLDSQSVLFHVCNTKKSVPAVLQRYLIGTMFYSLLVFGLF